MLRFATTVTTQLVGELDLTSFTECTMPTTSEPLTVNAVFTRRY